MAERENGGYAQPAIPKLDGYYEHWKILMENLLRSKDYWDVVETRIPPLGNTQEAKKIHDEAKMKDFKAKNYLYQAIDRNTLEIILKHETAEDIWESLNQRFLGSKKVKQAQLQVLRKDFEVLVMKEGDTVNEFFARTLGLVKKMKNIGESLSETVVVYKVLRSMTPRFNYVVCSIVQANDIETLTIDGLLSTILVEEQRMKGQSEDEQVLKVNTATRGRGRGRSTGRGRGRSKENIQCYKCQKFGHYQYECSNLEAKESKEGNAANFADCDEEEEIVLMTHCDETHETEKKAVKDCDLDEMSLNQYEEMSLSQCSDTRMNKEGIWFLDSACSTHMCGIKSWFFEPDESSKKLLKLVMAEN